MNTKKINDFIKQLGPSGSAKFCGMCEMSLSSLYNILNYGHSPNVSIAKRMAAAMGISLDLLCKDSSKKEK